MALIPVLFENFKNLNRNEVKLKNLQNHVVEFMYMKKREGKRKERSNGLNIEKKKLKNVISELENEGYLIKMPDPRDKRAVLVSLTSKGKSIQEEKWRGIYSNFHTNLAKLNEEEQLDLHFALHKLNVLLKKMEG
ncbi:winged helix DNA-binding protein [Priestia megaterium]